MSFIKETKRILRNSGKIDPFSIDDYLKNEGFKGLEKALNSDPDSLLESIIKSGLRGRGGAGFPTGYKMKFVKAQNDSPKYVVCNADEGEPGTFKDRILMETDPFLLLEGMLIAAYVIGAEKGYIYLRGEYHQSIKTLKNAINEARRHNFLGKSIFGKECCFDIELKIGAGSYLCGEELTLIESLEGKRGHPRIKPPYPAEKGLFGKPTLVNNVETLCNLPRIAQHGHDWLKQLGTEESPGTKIFTLSGDVNNPGFYEFPLGTPLRDIVFGAGGGISNNGTFKAALLGGAAGTFVNEDFLDVPMSYETLAQKNATLGSGAIIVYDNARNLKPHLRNIIRFFKHESCGKCVPCRVGCQQLLNIIDESNSSYTDTLIEEASYIHANSLCPLGQSPLLPVKSAITFFAHDFQ